MDSLQEEFGKQLQVLLINCKSTGDDPAKVTAFFGKWAHKYGKPLRLPSVVNDSTAEKLFEHRLIPHYVWISPEGKVIAVTSAHQVNAANISEVICTGMASFFMKKDQDIDRPIFSTPDLPVEGLLNYAVLIEGWFDGLPTGNRIRFSKDVITGRCMTNSPLLGMYKAAIHGMKPSFSDRQIILDVDDSSDLLSPSYSIDIVVPREHASQLYDKMMQLLNDYSGYVGSFEKRRMKCWALVRTSKMDLLKTKGGAFQNKLWSEENLSLRNGGMALFVLRLNALPAAKLLVVDETNYLDKVDLDFPMKLDDIKKIQEALKGYGMGLLEEEMMVEVFVVRKR